MAQAEFSFSGEAHSLPGGRERAQRGVGPAERSAFVICWTIWETTLLSRSAGEKPQRSDIGRFWLLDFLAVCAIGAGANLMEPVELLGHHQHGPERCRHKGRDEQEDGRVSVNWRHRSSTPPCRARSLNRPWACVRICTRLRRRSLTTQPLVLPCGGAAPASQRPRLPA